MNQTSNNLAQLESAKHELQKLPMLGPVMWLYARDPIKKFTFVGDMDWRLLPPLVLEQFKVFNKHDIPWAYFSWATVSNDVNHRLLSAVPTIAPHEWRSGTHTWLIDVVTPFGDDPSLIQEVCNQFAIGTQVAGWVTQSNGQTTLQIFTAKAQ